MRDLPHPPPLAGPTGATVTVLVVEDDEADALLVEEQLLDAGASVDLVRARTLAEALSLLSPAVDCVLLDLGLPDASGLGALSRLRAFAPDQAVIVLTGLDDASAGIAAVDAGAQDYLVKGQVDGELLVRAIRYAIARRLAEVSRIRLQMAEIQQAENARLERGLVPRPILTDSSIRVASASRPGRRSALLGGDFYDVVQDDDGCVHALIGDVCGHGPDEAALGASLRSAWRALVLAGSDDDLVLQTLQQILGHERDAPGMFVTLCSLRIAPEDRELGMRRAGHPAPLLVVDGSVSALPETPGGPPLGVGVGPWPEVRIGLPASWSLLLYTDGIIEGRVGAGSERLGEDRLKDLVADGVARDPEWRRNGADGLLAELIAAAESLHGGPLADDVALLLIAFQDAGGRS